MTEDKPWFEAAHVCLESSAPTSPAPTREAADPKGSFGSPDWQRPDTARGAMPSKRRASSDGQGHAAGALPSREDLQQQSVWLRTAP